MQNNQNSLSNVTEVDQAQGLNPKTALPTLVSKPKKKKAALKPKGIRHNKSKSLSLNNRQLELIDILTIQESDGMNKSYKDVTNSFDLSKIHPTHYRAIKVMVGITNAFLNNKPLNDKSNELDMIKEFIQYSEDLYIKQRSQNTVNKSPANTSSKEGDVVDDKGDVA